MTTRIACTWGRGLAPRSLRRGVWTLSVLGALGLVLLSGNVRADSPADIGQLEKELMNPCENCGGKPLAGSYCGGASAAKEELREMAQAGMSHDQIIGAFVAKYGEWILAVPERSGFNLFAWVLPVVGMVLGGGGLALFLKRTNEARRLAAPVPVPAGPGPMSPMGRSSDVSGARDLAELRRRLEREVRED
ncbi:MAG: cytochrome c-type biogenesis protein CcmH [Candidatus Eisenbacteria bacterium]